jgi:hypothetical protein
MSGIFNYFSYNTVNGEIVITNYNINNEPDASVNVLIPLQISEKNVTTIGDDAFNNKNINSIKFADGSFVTTIGSRAFANSKLTSIIIPDRVTSIGTHAFNLCNNLISVTLSKNITYY